MGAAPEEEELSDLAIRVSELMTRNVIGVGPSDSTFDVAELMERHGIGAVVVRSGEDALGIITERDVIKRCVAGMKDRLPSEVRAKEIMTKGFITIDEDADIFEAARKMSEHRIRRLIVMNAMGKMVGIISMRDIIGEAPHIWFILSQRLRMARSPRSGLSLI